MSRLDIVALILAIHAIGFLVGAYKMWTAKKDDMAFGSFLGWFISTSLAIMFFLEGGAR